MWRDPASLGTKGYCCAYPDGKGGAPSCCPGASTWHTEKCCVISCMSSKLKKVLKQDLSVRQMIGVSYFENSAPFHHLMFDSHSK